MSNLLLSIGRYERGGSCSEDDVRWDMIMKTARPELLLLWLTDSRPKLNVRQSHVGPGSSIPSAAGPVCAVLGADGTAGGLFRCAPFVTVGGYLVVEQTILDHALAREHPEYRGPYAALCDWLGEHPEFEIDEGIEQAFEVTMNPFGWLRRVA